MALNDVSTKRPAKVGYVSHEALVRIDRRVATILARRKAALEEAQLAARRLKRPLERLGNIAAEDAGTLGP